MGSVRTRTRKATRKPDLIEVPRAPGWGDSTHRRRVDAGLAIKGMSSDDVLCGFSQPLALVRRREPVDHLARQTDDWVHGPVLSPLVGGASRCDTRSIQHIGRPAQRWQPRDGPDQRKGACIHRASPGRSGSRRSARMFTSTILPVAGDAAEPRRSRAAIAQGDTCRHRWPCWLAQCCCSRRWRSRPSTSASAAPPARV